MGSLAPARLRMLLQGRSQSLAALVNGSGLGNQRQLTTAPSSSTSLVPAQSLALTVPSLTSSLPVAAFHTTPEDSKEAAVAPAAEAGGAVERKPYSPSKSI